MGTRDQMAEQCHPTCRHCMSTATYSTAPSRTSFAFSRDPEAGSSWQIPTQEAENSGNIDFSIGDKKHSLPTTHIHNPPMDGRAESSGPRAGSDPQGLATQPSQISSSLYHPLPAAAQTLLIHLPGPHRGICS